MVWWIGSKKCLGLEKVRDPVERVIVHQDGAQKALLRLDTMGSAAESGGSRVGSEFQNVRNQAMA